MVLLVQSPPTSPAQQNSCRRKEGKRAASNLLDRSGADATCEGSFHLELGELPLILFLSALSAAFDTLISYTNMSASMAAALGLSKKEALVVGSLLVLALGWLVTKAMGMGRRDPSLPVSAVPSADAKNVADQLSQSAWSCEPSSRSAACSGLQLTLAPDSLLSRFLAT